MDPVSNSPAIPGLVVQSDVSAHGPVQSLTGHMRAILGHLASLMWQWLHVAMHVVGWILLGAIALVATFLIVRFIVLNFDDILDSLLGIMSLVISLVVFLVLAGVFVMLVGMIILVPLALFIGAIVIGSLSGIDKRR